MTTPVPFLRRCARRLSADAGFTMIEVVMASVVFLAVATGIAGVLVSSITSHATSRERTRAEQIGQAQLEKIRTVTFDNLHNLSAQVPANGYTGTVPAGYSVSIDVSPVIDGTVTKQNANDLDYRKVTVVVTRTRDNRKLATLTTLVSPPDRFGGAKSVAVTVNVKDWAYPLGSTNSSVQGATVFLDNGPSPDDSAVTGVGGTATFFSLLPTTASAPTNYYDLTVSKSGYVVYPPDLPPAPAAHIQLAPSETASTTIRVFKPASIHVALKDGGTAYTGPATIKVFSQKTSAWTTFTTAGDPSGVFDITSIAGDYVYPNVQYSVYAYTSTGLCSSTVQQNVPDSYPTTMDTTFNMAFGTCPSGDLTVNVKQLGIDVAGATVTLTGGPNSVSLSSSPVVTDANGDVTFTNVPSGSVPYTVTATRTIGGNTYSGNVSSTISTGANTAAVTLANPATATVNITAKLAGTGTTVSGATVTLGNSPFGVSIPSQTTNASGVATFTGVAVGTGYTVDAIKSGVTGNATGLAVTAPTTNADVLLDAGSIAVTVTQGGLPGSSAAITITGGPFGVTRTATANASGVATVAGLPAGTGYTVEATRAAVTGQQTSVGVIANGTTPVTIALAAPPSGTVPVNVKWAGQNVNNASVRIFNTSLGVDLTQTTDSSGNTTFSSVIAGSGYTVSATANGTTVQNTSVTVVSGINGTINLALPTSTLTVNLSWAGIVQNGIVVTLSNPGLGFTAVNATTNSSGVATFNNVPATSGFALSASRTSPTATASATGITVGSPTHTENLSFPTVAFTVHVMRSSGSNRSNACVQWSGGPIGGSTWWPTGDSYTVCAAGLTDSNGNKTMNLPAGSNYSFYAYGPYPACAATSDSATVTNKTVSAGTIIDIQYNSSACAAK